MKYSERAEVVDSLRQLLAFYESPDGLEMPYPEIEVNAFVMNFTDYGNADPEADRIVLRKAALALRNCEKKYDGVYVRLFAHMGIARIKVASCREALCKRVKVGTKVVPKMVQQGTEIVDDYEWVCEDSLLKKVS